MSKYLAGVALIAAIWLGLVISKIEITIGSNCRYQDITPERYARYSGAFDRYASQRYRSVR